MGDNDRLCAMIPVRDSKDPRLKRLKRGSNPGALDQQTNALPTELPGFHENKDKMIRGFVGV